MKNRLMIAAAVAAMFAVGACATKEAAAPMKEAAAPMKEAAAPMKDLKTMSGDELAKEFKSGSKVCAFTSADGKTKGEDFYYKNQTAMSGDLDRNIGSDTKQGSWKILGPGFWVKIGTGKKVKGTWMNLVKTGKKSYDAYDSSRNKVMSMKCK